MLLRYIMIILLAYFLGAISFGALISKLNGVDILKVGSGNPGFTNVLRTQGGKIAALVLAGDMLKGIVAVAIGNQIAGEKGMLLAAVFVIVGHSLSPMLHFKGGKGIATGAGVLLYISPLTFLLCMLTVVGLAFLTKYMSVGSICSAVMCPFYLYLSHESAHVIGVFTVCCIYVIFLHRKNIVRLMNGTENKLVMKRRG